MHIENNFRWWGITTRFHLNPGEARSSAVGDWPVPNRTSGFVCRREEIRCWASTGRASSPSGHTMLSTRNKPTEREREIMVDGTWLTVCFTYQLRSVSNDAISTEILWSLTCNDLSKQLLWSVSKKRHAAHQELIQDDAHRPPVHWLSITLTKNNLWGDILWSSAHLKVKQQSVVS